MGKFKKGIELGRKIKPRIYLGICGEHRGYFYSIVFFNSVVLVYVFWSYRVPIAILSAAQAGLIKKK